MFVIRNKVKLKIPNGWHELPWIKGLYIFQHPNISDVELMALITGVSEDEIRAVNDTGTVSKLLATYLFLGNPPDQDHPELPRCVELNGTFYHVPFTVYDDPYDFGNASVGAIEDMKAAYGEAVKGIDEPLLIDCMKSYPKIAAIYLQSLHGYDYNKAMELVKPIESLDFKTVYNIGNFFLKRLNGLRSGHLQGSSRRGIVRRKFKRAYWILMQRLVGILPWIR